MTILLTCVKTPYLRNFSSLGKLLNIIITNNWFMTNNANYRITAQLIICLTLSIITFFSVDCPIGNLRRRVEYLRQYFGDAYAGCILQSASMAFVELVALVENLHRNGFFTSEKVMFSNARNKADQFWFKKSEFSLLGTKFYRACCGKYAGASFSSVLLGIIVQIQALGAPPMPVT